MRPAVAGERGPFRPWFPTGARRRVARGGKTGSRPTARGSVSGRACGYAGARQRERRHGARARNRGDAVGDLLLPLVRDARARRRLPALAAEREYPAGHDRRELLSRAWRLLVDGRARARGPDDADLGCGSGAGDRLVVGARFRRGGALAGRRRSGPIPRPRRRRAHRAVRGPHRRERRRRHRRSQAVRDQRCVPLRIDGARRQRLVGAEPLPERLAHLREHAVCRQGVGRWLHRALHLRRADLRRQLVPPHVRAGSPAEDSLRTLRRSGLRRPSRDPRRPRQTTARRCHL